jgi:hypothetical protein
MSDSMKQENVAVGEIIFNARISAHDIEMFVKDLLAGADGDRYLSVYIRPKEPPRKILGFKYDVGSDFNKEYTKYYHKITDMLKRRFGNDCSGWSISGPVWVIR